MNFIAALRLLEVVRVWVSFMQSHLRRIQKIKIFMYIFKSTNAISFVTVHVYTYIYAYMHFQIIFPSLRAFKFAKSKQKLFGVTRLWVYSTPSIVGFIYIQTHICTYIPSRLYKYFVLLLVIPWKNCVGRRTCASPTGCLCGQKKNPKQIKIPTKQHNNSNKHQNCTKNCAKSKSLAAKVAGI